MHRIASLTLVRGDFRCTECRFATPHVREGIGEHSAAGRTGGGSRGYVEDASLWDHQQFVYTA